MPGKLTSYSILIELPDELEEEQRTFGDTVHAFNETVAIPRGALFVPLGWESGVASPPSVIHEDFRTIDYFVMVLWDRWPKRWEEEYKFALDCVRAPDHPMRQVVPFLKSVAHRQLGDPGEELRRVLDFKGQLESEGKSIFEAFDECAGFETRLRWHLSRWLIDHENRSRSESTAESETAAQQTTTTENESPTETHPLGDDPASFNDYGLFLQRQGMLEDAEAMHQKALEFSKDHGTSAAGAVAYGNLGVIYHRQRNLDEAEAMFLDALAICEQLGRQKGMAASYSSLGVVYRSRNDLAKAEEMFRSALEIEEELGRAPGIASCYENLALIADFRDQPHDAETMRRMARAVGEEPEYPLGELFPRDV